MEDLLAIARIERGVAVAAREPVLLQHLARQAADAEERRWTDRRVIIHAAPDLPAVRGDESCAMQILRNLVLNAVKYGPADKPVEIDLHVQDGRVWTAVLDRGAGFPVGTGPDAFHLFYRSPDVAAHMSGTGIGLYVARALVEHRAAGSGCAIALRAGPKSDSPCPSIGWRTSSDGPAHARSPTAISRRLLCRCKVLDRPVGEPCTSGGLRLWQLIPHGERL